jgi:hypothetical protein
VASCVGVGGGGGACRPSLGYRSYYKAVSVWRMMPLLMRGSVRSCCRDHRRRSAQFLRRAYCLAGVLFVCICLTVTGFLNKDWPASVTAVPSYGTEDTLNTVHRAEADLNTPVRTAVVLGLSCEISVPG